MSDLAVSVRGLGARRGAFRLDDVTFEVPTGYVMGFVGPNGAGKTTTIRCLLGLVRPDAGAVEVLGHPWPLPVAAREDVGVVLDHTSLVGEWRLSEVERALRPFYRRWDTDRYAGLLDAFGLDRAQRVKDLSRGMAMKLTIAVALSHHARLLLLDEPTSGLDPVARDELVGILGEHLTDPRHSVLFSTHITTDLERIADHVTVLHAGRVVRTGAKDELLEGYRIVRGGPDDLPDGTPHVIGVRRTATGVAALVPTDRVDDLVGDLVVDLPTLDDVVVHVGMPARPSAVRA